MKLFPFKFIRKTQLKQLSEEYTLLQSQITAAADFIREIEKGNLEVKYHEEENLSEKETEDPLANSLVSLRKQMVSVSLEESQRSWVAETRSKFIDILRSKNNDLRELADDIISHLVKNLSANQGGLYLLNDDDADNVHIELLACYAYERKKYISKRIEIGHGLIGQTILEKETIYLTTIPENYLKITSGLGDATPGHLLIVPLKLEDKVYGAIEIASFHPIKEYEVEFAEQLGESIASTIANVKNNHQTKRLLEETQQQTEEMRAQEEEVRQNMEELSATQEEMQRISGEMTEQLRLIDATIATIEFDMTGVIKDVNDNFLKLMDYEKTEVVGKHHKIFLTEEDSRSKEYKEFWETLASGQSFEGEFKRVAKGGRNVWIRGTYAPMLNKNGDPVKVVKFAYDITSEKEQREEMQQQAEEMRAQEEGMRQVMKEVHEQGMFLNSLINASLDAIFVIDQKYCLIDFNNSFQASLSQMGMQLEKGGDIFQVYAEAERARHKELYDRVFGGEAFEITEHIAEADAHYMSSYNPLKNEQGEVYACVVFAKDITELIKSKEHAEGLLHESHQQAEELKAQEEELRQNMEELSATQEDMHRVMKEVQASEHYLNELLNVTQDTVYTLDKDGSIISFNTYFEESMKGYGLKMEKGFDFIAAQPSEKDKKQQKQIIKKVFSGEAIEIPIVYEVEGGEIHLLNTYSPIKNIEGEIIAAAVYSKDITELVMTKKQLQKT
ncbi:MAG: PAS domain S-box protein [Cyclobacteriaceae bacterium]